MGASYMSPSLLLTQTSLLEPNTLSSNLQTLLLLGHLATIPIEA